MQLRYCPKPLGAVFGQLRTRLGALGRVRVASGEDPNCPKALQSARNRPKSPRKCPKVNDAVLDA
eukprot:7264317-Alexandrium_andersonii.AAC.1